MKYPLPTNPSRHTQRLLMQMASAWHSSHGFFKGTGKENEVVAVVVLYHLYLVLLHVFVALLLLNLGLPRMLRRGKTHPMSFMQVYSATHFRMARKLRVARTKMKPYKFSHLHPNDIILIKHFSITHSIPLSPMNLSLR